MASKRNLSAAASSAEEKGLAVQFAALAIEERRIDYNIVGNVFTVWQPVRCLRMLPVPASELFRQFTRTECLLLLRHCRLWNRNFICLQQAFNDLLIFILCLPASAVLWTSSPSADSSREGRSLSEASGSCCFCSCQKLFLPVLLPHAALPKMQRTS